jgi:hypothetical protein
MNLVYKFTEVAFSIVITEELDVSLWDIFFISYLQLLRLYDIQLLIF